MLPNEYVYYELQGKSLEAARTLREKIITELTPLLIPVIKPKGTRSLGETVCYVNDLVSLLAGMETAEIVAVAKSCAEGDAFPLMDAFKKKHKNLYDAIGQNSPAIQVKVIGGVPPRAYAFTPEIHFYPSDHRRMIMIAPVDHRGAYFVPEDALRLADEVLYNDHSPPESVISPRAPYGVHTPVDFDPATSQYVKHSAPFDHGKTVKLLRVFSRIKPYLVESGAVPGVTNADDVSLKCLLLTGKDNRPRVLVQAFNDKTQQTLSLKDNAYFTAHHTGDGFYDAIPRAHNPVHKTDTAGGLALQSFFDGVPDLSAEKVWKICDYHDRETSLIEPPPPPLGLLHLNPQAPWPFPKSTP